VVFGGGVVVVGERRVVIKNGFLVGGAVFSLNRVWFGGVGRVMVVGFRGFGSKGLGGVGCELRFEAMFLRLGVDWLTFVLD